MKVPFSDLKSQYKSIKLEIDKVIQNVLDSASFILGKETEDFEKNFASFCGAKYCVGVSSGTSALHLALLATGIKSGDEVITAPNTFIATSEAIMHSGAKVKFADIDEKTYTLDADKLEKAITSKTKAIIPVHLFGQPCDIDKIIEIAKKHNLRIIEDCAQAHGAEYKKKKVPASGIGCFSFFPGKNLGAYGDAGAVVTNDEKIAEKCRMFRDHGRKPGAKYEHAEEGFNHRIDAIQSAVLNVKLKYLDKWTEQKREIAKKYNELFKDCKEIISPYEAPYSKHVYHLYVIRTKERDKLMEFLKKNEIITGIHYPIPLHLQPAYKHLNLNAGSFPVAEKCSKEMLSLPIFPEMTEEQTKYVCEKIRGFFKE